MDPLSALKIAGFPDFGSQVAQAAQDAQAGPKISIPDLQQLSPGLDLTAPAAAPSSGADAPSFGAGATSGGASFSNVLGGFIQEVSDKQAAANDSVAGLLGGKNVSLHQTMISMEEASVSFQLMVEVRNRLLDSYQELMRMQV
jgi:flagellar hook-basal body complex protein FliE